jgi:hypothetical protein
MVIKVPKVFGADALDTLDTLDTLIVVPMNQPNTIIAVDSSPSLIEHAGEVDDNPFYTGSQLSM